VDVSLATPQQEDNWSVDVLDISAASSVDNEWQKGDDLVSEPINRVFPLVDTDKNYPRNEMLFFIGKKWTNVQRQLFMALNFARLVKKCLISVADLSNICAELEQVLTEYVLESQTQVDSFMLISALEKSASDETISMDPTTRKYNEVYIEVSFREDSVTKKKEKFDSIQASDPVTLPPNLSFLSHSIMFIQMNMSHLDAMESKVLQAQAVDRWDFLDDQRLLDTAEDPFVELNYLLQERRRNPNRVIDPCGDWEADNQARAAKIWSEYDRDYMFRRCKFAIPYAIDNVDAEKLYNDLLDDAPQDQTEMTILDKQLMRTRIKQEEDVVVDLRKQHDDVEARQYAISNHTIGTFSLQQLASPFETTNI